MKLCCKTILCDMYSFQFEKEAQEQHFLEIVNGFRLMTMEERKRYFLTKRRRDSNRRIELYGKWQKPIEFAQMIKNKIICRVGQEKWQEALNELYTVDNNQIWISVEKKV